MVEEFESEFGWENDVTKSLPANWDIALAVVRVLTLDGEAREWVAVGELNNDWFEPERDNNDADDDVDLFNSPIPIGGRTLDCVSGDVWADTDCFPLFI